MKWIGFRRFTGKKTYLLLAVCAMLLALPLETRHSHTVYAAKLNKTVLDLVAGGSDQLLLKGGGEAVTWKSSSPSIAVVSAEGIVTGISDGTCTITASPTAKKSKKQYTCLVTVRSLSNVNANGAMKGIDVSAWQGTINFRKVKQDGIRFVIIRAGHGDEPDTLFERNYARAKRNGLMVGCYWFITATSKKALKAQANLCLETISGKTFDFPVFADLESYSQFNKGKDFCSMLVKTFCEMMRDAGFLPGWYTSTSFIKPYLSDEVVNGRGYDTWVAAHAKTLNYDNVCDFWQFSHTGTVAGIKGYVDLDWYFPNARMGR